ncbi:mucin-5AC [Drosophila ficusphila]|uniref:mucin-5AC n=1 Tax=Drosophila ficusphila TaxID=30025 RepID=UPI0007E7ED7A|nr:mucin-5AC [Drosophila ficusphila]
MLGKVKPRIVVIYMTIGLFYILLNIKASSTFMRSKRQMWSVDHPSIVLYRQHPSAMRKFYWYNTRTPILVGKMRLKNYMRSMHMLPRYMPSPAQYHEAYANSKRSVFRDLNNVHGFKVTSTPATTVDYVAAPVNVIEYSTAPVSPPVDFNFPPVNAFIPLTAKTLSNSERWNPSNFSNENWKKCPDQIYTAGSVSENCFKNTLQDIPKDQYSSHTIELPVTTTTTMPYFNYVAHTYFTLDDVILPHSSSKFHKPDTKDQHTFLPSHQVFTTEIPQETFTERFQRTTEPIPTTTSTTVEAVTPTRTTFLDKNYSTRPSWFSPTTFTTITTTTEPSAFKNPPTWTTSEPVKITYPPANVTKESFKHRLKSIKATKNYSSNIETKLKLLKLHLKNLVTTKETPRIIQNLTTSAVFDNTTMPDSTTTSTPVTRRTNINRKLRKLRVSASTKKVPIQVSINLPNSNAKIEQKKSKRIYQRRKYLNTTAAPEPVKNTTIASTSINKFRRRTTATSRKTAIVDEKLAVRNSTNVFSHTIAKSRSDGVPEEKSALVTESAIMTISSGNVKIRQPLTKVNRKQHSARKIKHLDNDNFIPTLPIEVYFKKVNQQ